MRYRLAAFLLLPLVLVLALSAASPSYTTWSDYGGSADSMQYSALQQINKSNVARLELACTYPVPGATGRFGINPIVVGWDDVCAREGCGCRGARCYER